MSIFKEISFWKKVLPRSVFLSDSREEKKKNFYNQLEEWTSHIVGGTRLSEILFVRNFSKEKTKGVTQGWLHKNEFLTSIKCVWGIKPAENCCEGEKVVEKAAMTKATDKSDKSCEDLP